MVTVVSTVPHRSVVKEVICRNCGATLNYVPLDIKKDMHTDYTGDKEEFLHIVCPPCGHKIGVKRF